jgi:hypothetical protein
MKREKIDDREDRTSAFVRTVIKTIPNLRGIKIFKQKAVRNSWLSRFPTTIQIEKFCGYS